MTVPATLEKDLEQLGKEIRRLDGEADQAEAKADKMVEEMRSEGIEPLNDKDAFEKVDSAYREADELREEASVLRQRRERFLDRQPDSREGRIGDGRAPGWAGATDALLKSEAYQRLKEVGAFTSGAAQAGIELAVGEVVDRDQTLAMLRSGFGSQMRAATADVDDMVAPDLRLVPPVTEPVRPIRVTQLVMNSTTDSDQVDYVEQTTRTDAAAETAPGTAYGEATYVFAEKQAPVRDIGHFSPAHRRNLADEGQIRGIIEGQLAYGVEARLESQIVSGDGTGQNLTGILNTTGIGSIARGTSPEEKRLEAIHRGITTVRLGLFMEPDAIGIHPSDYEETVFEKDDNGQYLLGPASQQTSRTIWGFPTSITTAFPENTTLVGAYRMGATLWLRSGVSLRASESHSDYFTKRMVALLAELRAAFAAIQPDAFCEVTGQ